MDISMIKKKYRRIAAAALAAVMVLGAGTASAKYPEHNKITTAFFGSKYPIQVLSGGDASAFKARWIDTASSYGKPVIKETSDERYSFFVGGQRFVLLDTDENGNYFIGADETYGKKMFNAWDRNSNDDYMAAYSGSWTYNPDRPENIAYWLNNGFLEGGNGGKKLPESIVSSLVEKDWVVEGGSQIKDDTIWKTDAIKKLVSNPTPQYPETGLESYSVRQKVSLMSLTEYVAYSDIFSPRPYDTAIDTTTWQDGWILRTPKNMAIKQESNGSVQSCVYLTPQMGGGTGNICALDNSKGHQIKVRPVFWIESDFFKNHALDLSGTEVKAGSKVIEAIKSKYAKSELSETYSKDVLINGFEYPEFAPLAAENVKISGSMAVGESLRAVYTYKHESAEVKEGATAYQWYVSGYDGNFRKIDGATMRSYTLTDADAGKKIKVSVKCADEYGNLAPETMSGETGAVREKQPIRVEINSFTSEDITDAQILIEAQEAGSAILLIGIYDENNMLLAMTTENVELSAGDNNVSIELDYAGGKKAKVFVISDMTNMKPYYAEEIIK